MNDDSTVPHPPGAVKKAPAIDGYEILEELGRGGMGIVYRARQKTDVIQRPVALKLILAAELAEPEEVQRFLREANVLASFQHPNIVTVYAAEWPAGAPSFIAMELLEGGSLADKLAGKPQPPREAAQVVETLARAMHAVHQRGVVHCDLKPGNVLVGQAIHPDSGDTPPSVRLESLTYKITDFGLARRLEDNVHSRSLGAVRGTPSYMAPEQASGMCRTLRPSADVWALGAILYEMLTGRPPFLGVDSWDTIRQVLSDEVTPASRLTAVPYDLETICLKCLQKAPRDRYSSALALADDLNRFLEHKPIVAARPGALKRLRLWAQRNPVRAVVAAAVLLVAVLSVFYNVELFKARGRTQEQLERANDRSEHRRQALRLAACLAIDHGLNLCRQVAPGLSEPWPEQIDHGLLWLGRALQLAERADDEELQSAIRRHLAFWEQPLRPAALPSLDKGHVWTVAISPDGSAFLTAGELPGEPRPGSFRGIARLRRMDNWNAIVDSAIWAWASPHFTVADSSLAGWVAHSALTADKGKQIGAGFVYDGPFWGVAFSTSSFTSSPRDVGLLAAIGDKGRVLVWRCKDGKKVADLPGPFHCVAYHPDGRTLITGEDGAVRFWQIDDLPNQAPSPAGEPLKQQGAVVGLAYPPDGKTLLIRTVALQRSGQPDPNAKGQTHLWDVEQRRDLGSLFQPYLPPLWSTDPLPTLRPAIAAFSQRDPIVLTSDEKRPAEAQLWDLVTRRPLGPPLRLVDARLAGAEPRTILSAAFTADGRTLFLANGDPAPWRMRIPTAVEGEVSRVLLWIAVRTHLEMDDNGVERRLDDREWEQRRRRLEEMGGAPIPQKSHP